VASGSWRGALPPVHLVENRPTTQSPSMSRGMSLFSVQAVLILSTEDGSRIFAKYYASPHTAPNGMHTASLWAWRMHSY
jgi:hypothetical protein